MDHASTSDTERLILNLLSDYCDRIDRYDVDGLVALFTEDGSYDFGFGRLFTGRPALRQLFSRVEVYRATSHHISNVHLVVDGDRATARSALYAFHIRAADGSEVHVWGQYFDDVVMQDGSWRIARRALRVAHEKGTVPEDGRTTLYEPLPRA
ncbi:MAG TPA: nuclear transport factor 2 family protein [Jatrophihabitantaceae bacterium]|nr:nuclear transport factor 2 family protein [Jatrophihabitantaceae bacterium]